MILPDVNLLIYAINRSSPFHAQTNEWWNRAVTEGGVALCWPSIVGFLRLSTHRRVMGDPLTTDSAADLVDSWLSRPGVHVLPPTRAHWSILGGFLRTTGASGNLTTDAHLAAHALEHGCTLYSNDSDFGRFPGLRWHNPIRSLRT